MHFILYTYSGAFALVNIIRFGYSTLFGIRTIAHTHTHKSITLSFNVFVIRWTRFTIHSIRFVPNSNCFSSSVYTFTLTTERETVIF